MDNPQYLLTQNKKITKLFCFKPYYKWITLNTLHEIMERKEVESFKPYYKWITLNTEYQEEVENEE